jgi:Holliday junction resolvase RusA-like endonuclease
MSYEYVMFAVAHRPCPKGSMKHIGHGRLKDQLKGTKPFGDAVIDAAKKAVAAHPKGHTLPIMKPDEVLLNLSFVFPRPKSTPKLHGPVTRSTGDVDKLCRNVFDALTTAGVMQDDSQVTTLTASKAYRDEDTVGYAYVSVRWWVDD